MNMVRKINNKMLILKISILIFIIIWFNIISRIYNFSNSASSFDHLKNFDKTEPKISIISPKIHIDNNWSDAKGIGICIGSGIGSDPYIIQNLEINAGGTGFCIKIENSQEYFEIKNCTLYNNGSSSFDGGILLNNITHGIIDNNSISLNGPSMTAIKIFSCNSYIIHENIININKTFTAYGIETDSSSDFTISNNLISGSFTGIQVNDSNVAIIMENNVINTIWWAILLSYCKNTNAVKNFLNDSITALRDYDGLNNNISVNTIIGCSVGIDLWYSNENLIENNTIINCLSQGIYFYNSSYNNVLLNKISYCWLGIYSIHSVFNSFSNNDIDVCEKGIYSGYSNNISIMDNFIYYSDIGIQLYKNNYYYLDDNEVMFSTDRGISSEYCNNSTISYNTIIQGNNTINYGVMLYNTDYTCIEYNIISAYNGIYTLFSNYNNISNNYIGDCKNGILLKGAYTASALFKVTKNSYRGIDTSDDQEVESEFGTAYRVADWNDILPYKDEIQEWISEIGMEYLDSYLITKDNQHHYFGEHYIMQRFDHNKPDNFTAYDNIDNHTISLGMASSPYTYMPILAFLEDLSFSDNSSYNSNYNNIFKNEIFNCEYGIYLNLSSNNKVINNSIYDNNIGIKLYKSHNNLIIKDFIKGNGVDTVQEFCEGNSIIFWNQTIKSPLDLGPFFMKIIVIVVLIVLLAVTIIIAKKGAKHAVKKKREKEKERVLSMKVEQEEIKKEDEEKELESIPNLERFIEQFIYKQFKNMEKRLPKIPPSQVDDFFKRSLKKRISLFYSALDSLGHKLSLYQESLLFDKCYDKSAPIRQDLVKLLEKQETRLKLEEQRRKTAEAFGEEITSEELIEKMDKLKSVDEEIDELLGTYEKWEIDTSKELSKGTNKIEFPSPKKIRQGKFNLFLSYSTLDSDYFHIQMIAQQLKQYKEIDDVLFWERDSGQNIVEYMEKALRKCNTFVLFCTERSLSSDAVKDEWQAAFQMRKKQMLKIIPVYEKEENIPRLLWHLLNVKYIKDDFEGFIKNLFKEILRPL
ncbi:MAG: right-handed parallel beta-helix repeat-containing protein [Promethearchaeota archaeon]